MANTEKKKPIMLPKMRPKMREGLWIDKRQAECEECGYGLMVAASKKKSVR